MITYTAAILSLSACYCYTLIKAHILLANVDKKVKVPRKANGAIVLADLKTWLATGLDNTHTPMVKKSIGLFKLSNYIVYVSLFLIICAMSAKSRQQQDYASLSAKITKP